MGKNTDKICYGMVGGGEGSFIGDVHRKSANFHNKSILVAGNFSRDYKNTLITGEKLCIDKDRLYNTYQEMAEKEANRTDGIDFVSIVTPNNTHYPIGKIFLENGINVICDKPLAFEEKEAEELAQIAKKNNLVFGVTYTYTGYPMVKQAREMIKEGKIGRINTVIAEYTQDWLADNIEDKGNKQAAWRINPEYTGKSNCVGDIGTHIEATVHYITGLKINSLCADLRVIGNNRVLDTEGQIMVKYNTGATGIYWCSQVAVGHENDFRIRIFGTKGSIEWCQEDPNYLKVSYINEPAKILKRGNSYLSSSSLKFSSIPPGHPEGYYEAFANIYNEYIDTIYSIKNKETYQGDFTDIDYGINGVKFISKCVESSNNGSVWISY